MTLDDLERQKRTFVEKKSFYGVHQKQESRAVAARIVRCRFKFRYICMFAGFCAHYPCSTLILGFSYWTRSPMLGSAHAFTLSYSAVKLFSKYSNLCDHGIWTSQTDGRTDGQTEDRQTTYCGITALCVYSALRGKNWMKIDPYYQRQKCRSMILVTRNVRYIRRFGPTVGLSTTTFYRVVLCGARLCHSMSSVCPSVWVGRSGTVITQVGILYDNNFTAD